MSLQRQSNLSLLPIYLVDILIFLVFFTLDWEKQNLFKTLDNVDVNGCQIHFALLLKPFYLVQNKAKPTRRQICLSDGENAVACSPSDRRARRGARSRSLRRIVGGYRSADRILRRADLWLRSLRLYFGKTGFRFDNVKSLCLFSYSRVFFRPKLLLLSFYLFYSVVLTDRRRWQQQLDRFVPLLQAYPSLQMQASLESETSKQNMFF